jgi:ubiquinone/menaquinone biosynthesis C-methylase UbiE
VVQLGKSWHKNAGGEKMQSIEGRKLVEAQFHDKLRDPALREDPEQCAKLTSNKKWYSVNRKSKDFAESYLRQHSEGAKALDYACGDGLFTFQMAEAGADAFGIDISPVSVSNAAKEAEQRGVSAKFAVMDCENLEFSDNTFDLINVSGVLHHLDVKRAYSEMARVLKPTGSVLCVEALRHNPIFHAYRMLTPHLRTDYEARHILRRRDVLAAREYFGSLEWRFFHLASVVAVPFRKTRVFEPVLSALETIDSAMLKVTPIRWWAWQIAFVLSNPKGKNEAANAGSSKLS